MRTIKHSTLCQGGSNAPFSRLHSRQGQMRTERFRLTEKTLAFTSLFDHAMNLSNALPFHSLLPILRRPDPQHARTLRTGESAESFKRHVHRWLTSDRLFNHSQQRINDLLVHVAEKLDREMHPGRRYPGDAHVSLHLRLNALLQLLLESRKLGPQLLRQFDGKKRPDHFKPALFMTVRREIAEPRRELAHGAWRT